MLREKLKKEYYTWINKAGINIDNCSPEIKKFLFGLDDILEGNKKEKMMKDIEMEKNNSLDTNHFEYSEGPIQQVAQGIWEIGFGNNFEIIQDIKNNPWNCCWNW